MRMRPHLRTLLYFIAFLASVITVSTGHAENSKQKSIVIGSKTFTENVILGELAAQLIQSHNIRTTHRKGLGGTRVLWSALLAGEIHVYPEYSGTLMQEIFADHNIKDNKQLSKALAQHGIRMTEPLGFNNTYVIGMKKSVADRLNINTVSDLQNHPDLKLGFSSEFMNRADGWQGLRQRYQLPQQDVRGLDHDLAYRGIESDKLDVIDLYATDAEISYYNLKSLKDDRQYFPAYHAVFLYRADADNVAPALKQLQGAIDESAMVKMNAKVKIYQVPEISVASNFIKAQLNIVSSVTVETELEHFIKNSKDHLALVAISLSAAILFAIPLGVIAVRRRRIGRIILGAAGIIQTIPSLALFVFMIPLLGIGGPPAMVALFLYSLLPIIRNTHSGLNDISRPIKESAEALGLSSFAKLRLIELPLATRSILAGIKISAVINVGTATLGALIGAGGYGQPILTGIRLDDIGLILQGAIPAAGLAFLIQGMFDLLERFLLPRSLKL